MGNGFGKCLAMSFRNCLASDSCNGLASSFLGISRHFFASKGSVGPLSFLGCRQGSLRILSLDTFHVKSVFVPQIHGAKITFFGFVKRCKTVVCVALQIRGEDFSSFYEKVW